VEEIQQGAGLGFDETGCERGKEYDEERSYR